MSLQSMTGFARQAGDADWGSWFWEAKSVNGRGLDVRVYLPNGWEQLEKPVKAAASDRLTRGNVQLSLKLHLTHETAQLSVNEQALRSLVEIYERFEGAPPKGDALAALLNVRGVVEPDSAPKLEDDLLEEIGASLIESACAAIEGLVGDRSHEGASLRDVLRGQLSEMAGLVESAAGYADEQMSLIQTRFRTRLAEIDSDKAVSEDRMAAEIAVLATKADVREELDRLRAHIATGQGLLDSDDAVGRNLGFLSQELNREANTLCSKSASLALTDLGLALKGVVDQFREQAANVE